MPGKRLVVAVLLATAAMEAGASVSLSDLSRSTIQSCIAALRDLSRDGERPELEPHDLDKHCPTLARDLKDLTGGEALSDMDIDAVSVEGVRDLAAIVDGFHRSAGASRSVDLDFDGLDALLDDVLIEKTSQIDYWDRFLRWLEEHLRDEDSPRLGQFLDWLEDLDAPPWLGEVLIKTSTVLIVLLALVVVGNELRLSGMPRQRRRGSAKRLRPVASEGAGEARVVRFEELPGLPSRALAAAAAEMVTAAFAERGWLSRSASLTNGELIGQVRERRRAAARPFEDLLDAVESIVYGDRDLDDESRRRLVADAGTLLGDARQTASGSP